MKYKALFLDIDGTLVGSDRRISRGNLEAIKKGGEHGLYITVATGRNYKGALPVVQELAIQGPVITYGGAMIVDTRGEKTLSVHELPPELVTEALELAHSLGLHAQLYQDSTVVFEAENEFTKRYTSALSLPFSVTPDIRQRRWSNVPKVLVYAPPEQEVEMQQRFREAFSGRLEVAGSQPGFIELNHFGCNKGTAILKTAELLGIRPEETAAIGDNTLDLEMIRMAGLGACVEDGQSVVKAVADIITPACEKDGVAWFIEYLLQA